jgi:hypothetical protein
LVKAIFLLAGLKYQEIRTKTNNNTAGSVLAAGSPTIRWEITAPDITKKNPA